MASIEFVPSVIPSVFAFPRLPLSRATKRSISGRVRKEHENQHDIHGRHTHHGQDREYPQVKPSTKTSLGLVINHATGLGDDIGSGCISLKLVGLVDGTNGSLIRVVQRRASGIHYEGDRFFNQFDRMRRVRGVLTRHPLLLNENVVSQPMSTPTFLRI